MKLNRNGYMIVEIVLASVLAMTIGYYLLNLTYKFKNTSEDIYRSYIYIKDKTLITKNIMSDLSQGKVGTVTINNKSIIFEFYTSSGANEKRKLLISQNNGKTKVSYGKYINSAFDTSDISYYEKELETSIMIEDIDFTKEPYVVDDAYSISIKIPLQSIYDDNDYTIKLFANKYNI